MKDPTLILCIFIMSIIIIIIASPNHVNPLMGYLLGGGGVLVCGIIVVWACIEGKRKEYRTDK